MSDDEKLQAVNESAERLAQHVHDLARVLGEEKARAFLDSINQSGMSWPLWRSPPHVHERPLPCLLPDNPEVQKKLEEWARDHFPEGYYGQSTPKPEEAVGTPPHGGSPAPDPGVLLPSTDAGD